MDLRKIENYTLDDVAEIFKDKADAVIIINAELDRYKSISRKGIFSDIIKESGNYQDLIEKLWMNIKNSSKRMASDYHVFIPLHGKFHGKYSKRLNLVYDNTPHIVQMTIYPLNDKDIYMLILDELDNSEYMQEFLTNEKINNIHDINASELVTIAENMRIKISEANFDTAGNITCSIGITEINKNDMFIDAFERVDKAMYSAKLIGRNCVYVE
jgi:hypothetical protein